MDDQQRELEQHRQRFRSVDTLDPVSLQTWFAEVNHLGSNSLSLIAEVSLWTISSWRKRAGISRPKESRSAGGVRYRDTSGIRPPAGSWKDPEWLIPTYASCRSPKLIADAAGVSSTAVQKQLHKLGVPKLGRIEHPCNNREWITKHYLIGLKSAQQCAQLAGVTPVTMLNWVTRHGFPTRNYSEQVHAQKHQRMAQVRFWIRELAVKLKQQPVVRRVRLMECGLVVRYRTGLQEIYWLDSGKSGSRSFGITQDNSRLQTIPRIHAQYPGTELDSGPLPYHFLIDPAEWQTASLLERRLALHEFLLKVRSTRPETYCLPADLVQQAWTKLKTIPPSKYLYKNTLRTVVHKHGRGLPNHAWPLVLHYVNLRPELTTMWAKPKNILKALNYMVRTEDELNTRLVITRGCKLFGPRMINPNLYRCLFRLLRISGTVLDLHPYLGCKAMACAADNLVYRTLPDERFDAATARGLADFLGLDHALDDGQSQVELVIADGNLYQMLDLQDVLSKYAKRAKRLVCFVPHAHKQELQERFKPARILGIKPSMYARQFDYLFVW